MIVIVIVGVVYTLAVTKLQSVGEKKVQPSLAHLKEYLLSLNTEAQSVRLLCLDDCSHCDVYADGNKIRTLDGFIDDTIESYAFEYLQGAVQKNESAFFNEENVQESVCFSFRVARNGVSDQKIVLYKERAYDYTNYFEPTVVYDSLEEAVAAKENLNQEVTQ